MLATRRQLSAYRGCQVLLIFMGTTKIGQVSCDPVTGGVVRGQLVRKINALGGLWGIVTDEGMTRLACSTALKGSLSGVPALGMPCPLCRPLAVAPGANLPPLLAG